ncbi:hypothetical protein V1514DRAFT_268623, partial [Lipomyces japonicus]|uniref:uncharacterized protein n=1 Tax=Lipomyces japonicus TaxID=56871 RepID=UPI0034CF9BE8
SSSSSSDQDDSQADQSTSVAVVPPIIRHIHHFDTYKVFNQLRTAGFTTDQSIDLMKCIRSLLTYDLQRAKESLLSSAELENEAYLFDAACSELRTEIQNNNKSQAALAQTEIVALQREFTALKQLYEEQFDFLKNEVNMELNERKNQVKSDHRATELQIQELNNRITILISSELRSETEGLRWQTTRQGLFAIGAVAGLILMSLSYRN